MASSVNKVIVVGYTGTEPTFKQFDNNSVCEFTVATSEQWKDKSGEKQERTEWHRVKVWGKLAEVCAKYLGKGRLVYVEGKLQTRSYDDKKDGTKRYITEVIAHAVQFLGKAGDGGSKQTELPVAAPSGAPDDMPWQDAF